MDARPLLIALGALLLVAGAFGVTWHFMSKRHAEVDRQLQDMRPKGTPGAPTPHNQGFVLRVVLSRVHAQDPERAQTVARIEGTERTFVLPLGGRGDTPESERSYDSVWFALQSVLTQRLKEAPEGEPIRGRIVRTGEDMELIPREDVTHALNALISADIMDVVLESEKPTQPQGDERARALLDR
jgi:hypothetical protein